MHRKHFPSMSESERIQKAGEFMSNPLQLQKAFVEMEQQMYRAICNTYRVYCLSEKPDSPLMWAHYTASHTGVCLEFNAHMEPFTKETGATKVEYQAAYPAYDIETVGYEPLVTKSADWSYEAEWRLIAEERSLAKAPGSLKTDNDFFVLPSGALKSVTIGCLANDASRRIIYHLVETHAPGVLVRQAAPSADRYELSINPPFR
jgi:hypothetical protein